jgi:hypothetical protein
MNDQKPSQPSQAKTLTGGRDLREAQVDIPLSVSHTCVDHIAGLCNRHLNSNRGKCLGLRFEVRLRAMTDHTKDWCLGGTELFTGGITLVGWLSGF